MKKTAILVALILPLLAGAVSPADLGLPIPGVLPSNPFYFFKEWKRGIRRSLTFDSVKTTQLELNILNERAAEISKLIEVLPDNTAVLESATKNYWLDLRNFHLEKELASDIVLQHLKHLPLFTGKVKDELLADLNELLADDNFVQEFRQLLNERSSDASQSFEGLMLAGAIDQLNDSRLTRVKGDLLIDFLGEWITKEYSDDLLVIGGQPLAHLKMLDELRFKLEDRELKSQLTIARQKFLKDIKEEQLANDVVDILKDLKISDDQTVFYAKQAKSFYDKGQFRAALGQATMAAASASSQSTDYQEEIKILKSYYDKLQGGDKELEKEIVSLADFINQRQSNKVNSRIEQTLIDLKLKIAIARHL